VSLEIREVPGKIVSLQIREVPAKERFQAVAEKYRRKANAGNIFCGQ